MQPYFKDWVKSEVRRLDAAVADVRRAAEWTQKASETALVAARRDLDRRVEALNEFRAQLSSEQDRYLPRVEFEGKHQLLAQRIEQLAGVLNDAKQATSLTTGRLFGGLAVVVFLVSICVGVVIKLLP